MPRVSKKALRGSKKMKAWDRVADFVGRTGLEKFPEAVLDQAKLVLLDSLGAMLAGSRTDPVPNLVLWSKKAAGRAAATVAGYPDLVAPCWAALVNGTSLVALEMDEGNQFAKGHPAAHVIPAALAWAEQEGVSGGRLLESVVVGYEVAARIGAAASLRPEVHPHGTWGAVGAAVAVAKLRNFPASDIPGVIQLGASFSLATTWQAAVAGATVRNLYTGLSNHLGLLATDFYLAGFRGGEEAVETVFGQVLSSGFELEKLTRDLGSVYQITSNYFKLYSCCRYNHAALDALGAILANQRVTYEEVEGIEVETYGLATQLANRRPANALAAKFSIPFALAVYLVRGHVGPHSFTEETLGDPQVRELAGKVTVRENPEMSAMLPCKRPARVVLCLRDGRCLSQTVLSARGGFDNPYPREALLEKFRQLAGEVIGAKAAGQLREACLRVEELADIRELTALLRT